MDFSAFDKSEFEKVREDYKDEVKSRWVNTEAYKEHEEKTAGYTSEKWSDIGEGMNKIISEFAQALKLGVKETDSEALALAEMLKNFITENQYTCTKEILLCLGEMYVADERFKQNIDKFGAGTADFMSKAIKAYCVK